MQVRVARPSLNYAETTAFYEQAVGLSVLASWSEHDGFDGVVFAVQGSAVQLELLRSNGHEVITPSPTGEDQLVLYLESADSVRDLSTRIKQHGYTTSISPNPYWANDGAECFIDPDGFWLVLSPSSWA